MHRLLHPPLQPFFCSVEFKWAPLTGGELCRQGSNEAQHGQAAVDNLGRRAGEAHDVGHGRHGGDAARGVADAGQGALRALGAGRLDALQRAVRPGDLVLGLSVALSTCACVGGEGGRSGLVSGMVRRLVVLDQPLSQQAS